MHFATFILKNLLRRPTRTALTVLGLAVAIGSTIALLGISDSFRTSMRDSFESRRVDLVIIEPGKAVQTDSRIDQAVVDAVRAMPDVAAVDAALLVFLLVERADTGSAQPGILVQGWLDENFGYEEMRIVEGRRLAADDAGKRRCILGTSIAQNFKQSAGGAVRIEGKRFEVVGVFDSPNVYENGAIITPMRDAQDVARSPGEVTAFSLRVRRTSGDPDADVERVRQKIQALTDPATGQPYRFEVKRPGEYLAEAPHLLIARAMAWVVSLIALLIGVISMLNTMAMAVLERTQEIGILRAVGWPRRRVVVMVLGESVLLALAAAAVGAGGAVAVTYLLTLSPRASGFIAGGIAPGIILQGLGITVLIGLLGGAYPAARAARMLPTEAIRHD